MKFNIIEPVKIAKTITNWNIEVFESKNFLSIFVKMMIP